MPDSHLIPRQAPKHGHGFWHRDPTVRVRLIDLPRIYPLTCAGFLAGLVLALRGIVL